MKVAFEEGFDRGARSLGGRWKERNKLFVAFLFQLFNGDKAECGRVDAETAFRLGQAGHP